MKNTNGTCLVLQRIVFSILNWGMTLLDTAICDAFIKPGKWYKGNLHSHSTASDGSFSPEELADC